MPPLSPIFKPSLSPLSLFLNFITFSLILFVGVGILRFWLDLAGDHGVVFVSIDFGKSRRRLRSTFTTAAEEDHAFDDFPFHGQSSTGVFRVVGTCNGLICLADGIYTYVYNFILWNPCVKKYVRLPNPNFSFRTTGPYTATVGFGFDSKTNDYKVVRFVTPEDRDFEEGEFTPKVEVYSLATGEWRVVTATAQCPKCAVRDTTMVYLRLQAFVNGALHFVCYKTTLEIRFLYFVLVFDLKDEVFREIPLPKHSNKYSWEWVSILAYGNSIAVIEPGYSVGTLDIWVLKNYADADADASSWTKIISLDAQAPPQEDITRPFRGSYRKKIPCAKAFRKSGEVILETYRKRLVS
nr:f-box protein [Quercus suber]